jgi:pyruvate dehydrogenase E1 component alpha subunit
VGQEPSAADLLRLYERMLLIRRTEERLSADSAAGKLPGAVHLYIGEEAVAAGVCAHLTDPDYVTSTHCGHGHYLAKGGDVNAMMAEIWGKRRASAAAWAARCTWPTCPRAFSGQMASSAQGWR